MNLPGINDGAFTNAILKINQLLLLINKLFYLHSSQHNINTSSKKDWS